MKRVIGVLMLLGWTVVSASAASDALLRKLVEKKILTEQEAAALQAEIDQEQRIAVETFNKTKVATWLDKVQWSGDLRLRAEVLDPESGLGTPDRWRFRYRLRLGMDARFVEWATIGVRLASGEDDPTATNQSFDDTFSRKELQVDRAYVMLQPPGTDWIKVSGGKIPNPFWQGSLINVLQYDPDLNPEGLAEQLQVRFGDKEQHRLFANFGQFVLDEVSSDSNDPFMFDFQAGGETKTKQVKATVAGGFYFTQNADLIGVNASSQPTGAADPAAQSSSATRGNATRQPGGAGTTLYYLDDFAVVYVRGEVAWTVCEQAFLGTPSVFTVGGEYLSNLANGYDEVAVDPGQTDAFAAQIAFGEARKKGQWQIVYLYKYQEADSNWDAISDSDWGYGGTDRKGHVVRGLYNALDWWQFVFTASITEKLSDRPNSGNNTRGIPGESLLRVQMDSTFKF